MNLLLIIRHWFCLITKFFFKVPSAPSAPATSAPASSAPVKDADGFAVPSLPTPKTKAPPPGFKPKSQPPPGFKGKSKPPPGFQGKSRPPPPGFQGEGSRAAEEGDEEPPVKKAKGRESTH